MEKDGSNIPTYLIEESVKDSSMQQFTNANTESNLEERLCSGHQQHEHNIHETYQAYVPQRDIGQIPLNTNQEPTSHCAPGMNFYAAHSSSRIPQVSKSGIDCYWLSWFTRFWKKKFSRKLRRRKSTNILWKTLFVRHSNTKWIRTFTWRIHVPREYHR